jgi:hypothetical protein
MLSVGYLTTLSISSLHSVNNRNIVNKNQLAEWDLAGETEVI